MKPTSSDVLGPVPFNRVFGKGSAQRIVGQTPEGELATGPSVPAQKWIDPSGNVVYLPVRTVRNQAAEDPKRYEAYITAKKTRQGWRPYWDFPDEAAREAEIARRKSGHHARSEQYRRAWGSQDEAEALKNEKSMATALARAVDMVASGRAAAEADPPKAKK